VGGTIRVSYQPHIACTIRDAVDKRGDGYSVAACGTRDTAAAGRRLRRCRIALIFRRFLLRRFAVGQPFWKTL